MRKPIVSSRGKGASQPAVTYASSTGGFDQDGHHYRILCGEGRVEAWTDFRLPFEPKGYMQKFKEELRSAISELPKSVGLYCCYLSTDPPDSQHDYDIENVLTYNVGFQPFENLGLRWLVFEGVAPVKDLPSEESLPDTTALRYYYLYETQESGKELRFWRKNRSEYLEISSVRCLDKINSDLKAGRVWAWIKHHMEKNEPDRKVQQIDSPFCLDIRIRFSYVFPGNLVAIIKPIFDGVTASMHYFRERPDPQIASRISTDLGLQNHKIEQWMMDQRIGVLGGKPFVQRYGRGVKWEPDDHLCVAGSLELIHDPAVEVAEMGFRISTLERAGDSV